jgi:uncharacterized membrane-anchored protein
MNLERGWLRRWAQWNWGLAVLIALSAPEISAEQALPPTPPQHEERMPWREGPEKIALGHALTLELPDGFGFLPREPAVRLMERSGNLHNEALLGVVAQGGGSWLVLIKFEEEGYVKDDEAEKLDADEILASIRDGTEESNKLRIEKGFKPVHVVGWSEPPRYDRNVHNLVWGVQGRTEQGMVVNFNTRVLGRHGYASLNLIDSADRIDAGKPAARQLLAATHFDPGARYEDFQSGKDKVAEYGLAALVAGGAGAAALKVVKIGLLAKFGAKLLALLLAAKKLVLVAVVGALAVLRRFFGRKQPSAPPPTNG